MKTVILVRHAKSEQHEYKGKEINRPITKKGERKAVQLADQLKACGLQPQRILSSPAKKACQTAEIIRSGTDFQGKIKVRKKLNMGESKEILKLIRALPDEIDSVLIVGHNPGLESLIPQLTHEIAALPHAGFAHLSVPIERWKDINQITNAQLIEVWDPHPNQEGQKISFSEQPEKGSLEATLS